MKSRRFALVISLGPVVLMVGLLAAPAEAADVIDAFPEEITPNSFVGPLGEQGAGGTTTTASYFGESFQLPADGQATSLYFAMQPNVGNSAESDDVAFRVLITNSTSDGVSLRPDTVLFESEDLTLPHDAGLTAFTIDLGGLSLTRSSTYFWILDSFVGADGEPGTAKVVGNPSLYEAGGFFATNVLVGSGSRADHLAEMSPPFEDYDLGFRLSYVKTGRSVDIDVRPGSDANRVNCMSDNALISVAVLTTPIFDASTINHTTVRFAGATEVHADLRTGALRRHESDADGDGDVDLVLHFRIGDTDLTCASTEARLEGQTFEGERIQGSGTVEMVPRANGTSLGPAH